MKTEQALQSQQQHNVEQSALFPKAANEPTTTDSIEIPDHDPVIFPSSDSAPSFDTDELTKEQRSGFTAAREAVRNLTLQAVYAAQLIDPRVANVESNGLTPLEHQAASLAAAVAFTGETLPVKQQEQLAATVVEALKSMPQSEQTRRLGEDLRTASQLARQHALELQVIRADISDVESALRQKKVDLQRELNVLPEDAPLYSRIKKDIADIDSILEREKKTPSTAELEAQLALPSTEAHSPAFGISVPLVKLAHKVVESTVHFAHKAKEILNVDEAMLSEAHDSATRGSYPNPLSNIR